MIVQEPVAITAAAGVAIGLAVLVRGTVAESSLPALAVVCVFGGAVLLAIATLAEYVALILRTVSREPQYFIRAPLSLHAAKPRRGLALGVLMQYLGGASVDWEGSFAYRDDASDLPLLARVGNPLAVQPNKRSCCHEHSRGWAIISRSRKPGYSIGSGTTMSPARNLRRMRILSTRGDAVQRAM